MNFFKNIAKSIYSPKFYSEILKKSFSQSLGYFTLLILLLTAINSITLVGPLLMEVPVKLENFIQETINCFPRDLEIKINNGIVSTNKTEPYFISSCEPTGKNINLFVVDTKTPFSIEKFAEYKVAAWVTKDAVFYTQNSNETRSYSLRQVTSYQLNQNTLRSYTNIINPWLKFVGPVLMIAALFGIYIAYLFRLIYLAIVSLIIWLLSKAVKKNFTYAASYSVSLHAITLGLIVEFIVNQTAKFTNFSGFPFMVFILTIGVVIVNLFINKKSAG